MAFVSSLKFRIAATIFVLEGLMMGLTLWQVLGAQKATVERQVSTQEQVTMDLLKGQARLALVTEEFTELQPVFESLQRDQRIVRAVLSDNRGRIVAAGKPQDLGRQLADLKPGEESYWRQQTIGAGVNPLGLLTLEFSSASLEQASAQVRNLGVLIAALGMSVIAVVGVATGWLLTRRLDHVQRAAQQVAAGQLLARAPVTGRDEVATLGLAFNQMAERIAQDQESLQRANAELEQRVQERTAELTRSMENLRQAQQQLVQSEKLAALGSLVAGVAHEINTPVGIGVTAASFLNEKVRDMDELFQSGNMRRSDMSAFLASAQESSGMVLANLQRAADLISSFKMVAVDQASAKRRSFRLKETLEEQMATLRHLLKGKPVQIEMDLAEGVEMDSYPGTLAQVFTNLLNNAVLHAFEGRTGGVIHLQARALDPEMVEIRFSDDGRGIPPEHLGRIFDPFFTTKFGQGGSGLGLNIVHNVVTGLLGGRIEVHSRAGEGTVFVLVLPRVAPAQAEGATA